MVLVGPPASGKTKIGKILATRMSEPFVDTDTVLKTRYGPIPEIFADQGEYWFRAREAEVVREFLDSPGVLSLGGGAVTTAATREALAEHTVVLLEISAEAVASRLNNQKRPLLSGGVSQWEELVAGRKAWYEEVSTWRVDVSHRPIEDVAEEIAHYLEGADV
ncbi:shikimate kinase [Pontimonas sp.]|uniref:shikimate kinase n=1 Tax=Pontimonas sp. TaxID=2304492 RepID=UPI00287063F7|nr:shikimate kinase [Pontimonas sp.]MDR9396456.1 shikimate kinase [Pontimonas sp.]MDR9434010.1 shikimate kinase [Pontimonas sp.]